jgi:RND family efflux transporter MFP subunit
MDQSAMPVKDQAVSEPVASPEELSSDQIKEPRPFRLLLVAIIVIAAAGTAAFFGLKWRASTDQNVAARTAEQAIPPVDVILPTRGVTAKDLVLPGDIEAFDSAPIYARATGYVSGWYKDIGAKVKKGDKLADIDTPELDQQYAQVKADLANAIANSKLADVTAERYHALVRDSFVSKQQDDQGTADAAAKAAAVESAKANLKRIESLVDFKTLVAPFDGVVTQRAIDIGQLITAGGTAGNALFQVADLHRVRIYVRVPQAYIGFLTPGVTATLRMPQYPGRDFAAELVTTSNAISHDSRTALVQLQADNAEGKLWPGTFTEVRFHVDANPNALSIPATALLFGERGIQVATVDTNQKVSMKKVQVGQDIGTNVEIRAGLSENDRIIDSPLESLNDGDRVRIVKEMRMNDMSTKAAEAVPPNAK